MSEQAAEAVVVGLKIADDASAAIAEVRVGGFRFMTDLRGEPIVVPEGWPGSATEQDMEEAAGRALEAYRQELMARGVDEGWRERNRRHWLTARLRQGHRL